MNEVLYVCDFRTEETDCLVFRKEVVSNQPINISFKIFWAGILSDTIPSETLKFHKEQIFIIFI